MSKLHKTLEQIGLSEKEAKVYLTCLKFPNQPTSIIAKKNTLNRGTTFVILNQLLNKGLIKRSISSNIQRFTALPPEELVTFLEKQEFTLKKNKEKILTLLPELNNLQGTQSKKPIFHFYEGESGLQNLISDSLYGEHQDIKSILSPKKLETTVGSEFIQSYTEKRIKKNLTMQAILPYQDYQHKGYENSPKNLRNTRYMPESLNFPMTMLIYGDTAILISHSDNFGLSIHSSEYVQMQTLFFDTIWAISKQNIKESDFRMPII